MKITAKSFQQDINNIDGHPYKQIPPTSDNNHDEQKTLHIYVFHEVVLKNNSCEYGDRQRCGNDVVMVW